MLWEISSEYAFKGVLRTLSSLSGSSLIECAHHGTLSGSVWLEGLELLVDGSAATRGLHADTHY